MLNIKATSARCTTLTAAFLGSMGASRAKYKNGPKGAAVKVTSLTEVALINGYRKVVSSSLSRLVAHFQIFRRLMKGKFDAYVL